MHGVKHVFDTLLTPHHRELRVESARRFGVPRRPGFQVFRDGIDGYQDLHRERAILDGDAELLLDAEHQFQRVDRVESDAPGAEERRIIADLLDRRGEIQTNGQDFPDLLFRCIHFQSVSSFFPVDEPAAMHLPAIFLSYQHFHSTTCLRRRALPSQDKQSRDPEEKPPAGRHPESLLPEDSPQSVTGRKHPKALRDISVDLRRPVEEEPPETAPTPQQKILQMPEEGAFRIGKVEERRHLSLIHISEPTRLGMISYAV